MLSITLKKSIPAPKKVGYQQSSRTASKTKSIPPLYLSTSHPRARYPNAKPAAHPTTKKETVHKSDINHAGGTISETPSDISITCGAPTKKRVFPLGTLVTAGKGYTIKDKNGNTPPALSGAGLYAVCAEDGRQVDTFTVTDEQYPAPAFLDNGIIYQIFVDRFYSFGTVPAREDAVYLNWDDTPEYKRNEKGELKNNTFFGGTLWGVAEKLDYIASLGAGSIYLSPICKAYSNHKYDTDDYLTVDEGFGGDEALKHLINAAEKRGIKIILDGVFNHVGEHSIYFTSALNDPSSPYKEWFSFSNYPHEYDCWWGCRNLPKTVKCHSFRSFICDQVIPKYMEMGVGGFRLDVVDEYSNEFTHEICAAVKKSNPRACIIGEVWEDASTKVAYDEAKDIFRDIRWILLQTIPSATEL